jgi:Zn-dependent peptidase ImmA (M78 family)
MYDPYEHAEALGITVVHAPIRTAHELWLPDRNTIVVRSGLRRVHDRSALAHGVAHAVLGHEDDRPKHEVQADRLAAANLIDLDECLELMKWTPDCARLARELDVSTRLARVFLLTHQLAG